MERNARGRTMTFVMALILALTATLRVSSGIRTVDILRLFSSGALFGVGLMGLIQMLRSRRSAS